MIGGKSVMLMFVLKFLGFDMGRRVFGVSEYLWVPVWFFVVTQKRKRLIV